MPKAQIATAFAPFFGLAAAERLSRPNATPHINATRVDFSLEDKSVILVDDVLFTGRTIRCALEALLDFGRPRMVKLLVLADRGHRELPIQADFIGKVIATTREQRVDVHLLERDGLDQVVLS